MTDTDSYTVRQFRNFLDQVEAELDRTLTEIENLKTEDPEYGYAKATGCAKAHLESIKLTSKVFRQVYLDA